MGRPSKYTPDIVDRVVGALESGMTDGDACRVGGISEKTFYEWQASKSEFRDRTTRARSIGWLADIKCIRSAAQSGDWRAAAELLDRTHSPYSKTQSVSVTHKIDRAQAERLADQYGLPVEDVIAEAERHLADARSLS
jgi:hypothetical protein